METAILTEEKEQFQKEQDKLLKTILDLRYFNPWRGHTSPDNYFLMNNSGLELYITNECNQKCEYCYLTKYPELYPHNKTTHDNILHNLEILYSYIMGNHFHIPLVEFFSGEIWHTQFGLDILEITYDYIINGLDIDKITIPTNCYFCHNDESLQKIQNIVNKFNNTKCHLCFSLSIDGKIIDNLRPRNNQEEYTDEFYDTVFTFAKFNNFLFHPMVAAAGIEHWKENYQWWKDMHKYYNLDISDIMLLEVRNDDWTEERIKYYCEFMKMLADEFLHEQCHDDIQIMANVIGNVRLRDIDPKLSGYIPWLIAPNATYHGCTVPYDLTVRLGDLAICPCHRQAYEQYLYGHFIVEDGAITGITARNPLMAVRILMGNMQTNMPLCDMCIYNKFCMRGCFGAQLEVNHDPFFPIKSVCDLYKAKWAYMLQYYRDKGIIDYYRNNISIQEFGNETILAILELDKLEQGVRNNVMDPR